MKMVLKHQARRGKNAEAFLNKNKEIYTLNMRNMLMISAAAETEKLNPVAQWVASHLGFLPPQMIVLVVSMLPVVELRGGIPVARILELPLGEALVFSLIGNLIPIPFILFFIDRVFNWLRPTRLFGGLVTKLETRAMNKSDSISKAEFWGLVAFVGIPLPGTGGWTGALIASLLKIDKKKAMLAILLGVAIAATIMSLISYGVFAM